MGRGHAAEAAVRVHGDAFIGPAQEIDVGVVVAVGDHTRARNHGRDIVLHGVEFHLAVAVVAAEGRAQAAAVVQDRFPDEIVYVSSMYEAPTPGLQAAFLEAHHPLVAARVLGRASESTLRGVIDPLLAESSSSAPPPSPSASKSAS